jgi:hypothetical protein
VPALTAQPRRPDEIVSGVTVPAMLFTTYACEPETATASGE